MIQLVLIQLLTFVVIVVVFYLLSGRHLQGALTRLQSLHQENLEKEEVLNKEMERAKTLAQSEVARGREEAKQALEAARAGAERITREAGERAERAAQHMVQEAMDRTKRLEAEILGTVEDKARLLAAEAIRSVFTSEDHRLLHDQLVRELVAELHKLEKGRLDVKAECAQVLTPRPLTAEERQALEAVLSAKLASAIRLEEVSDPDLILGVVIKLGALVIDASLKNKLNKVMAVLARRTTA